MAKSVIQEERNHCIDLPWKAKLEIPYSLCPLKIRNWNILKSKTYECGEKEIQNGLTVVGERLSYDGVYEEKNNCSVLV